MTTWRQIHCYWCFDFDDDDDKRVSPPQWREEGKSGHPHPEPSEDNRCWDWFDHTAGLDGFLRGSGLIFFLVLVYLEQQGLSAAWRARWETLSSFLFLLIWCGFLFHHKVGFHHFSQKHFPTTSVEFYNQLPPTAWKRLEEKEKDERDILMRWTRLIFCSDVAHDNDGDVV